MTSPYNIWDEAKRVLDWYDDRSRENAGRVTAEKANERGTLSARITHDHPNFHERKKKMMIHIAVGVQEGESTDEIIEDIAARGLYTTDRGVDSRPMLVSGSQQVLKNKIEVEVKRNPRVHWLILSVNTIGFPQPTVAYRSV